MRLYILYVKRDKPRFQLISAYCHACRIGMKPINNMEEIIDLELYAKEGKTPPKGKKYRIRVDNQKYDTNKEELTGREILTLAGKVPVEKFQLNQKFKGGVVKKIGYDEKVDLTAKGVERFMTVPLDQTEG